MIKKKAALKNTIRTLFSGAAGKEFSGKQVCVFLEANSQSERTLVYSLLKTLSRDGFLSLGASGTFFLSPSSVFFCGVLQITPRGSGFVVLENGDDDVFVSQKNRLRCLDGDRVKIQIKKTSSRREGVVVEVLVRERSLFFGTIKKHKNFAFLVPDNERVGAHLYIQKEKLFGAKDGDRALAKISAWPKTKENPYGEIVEVFKNIGSLDAEMMSILVNQGLDFRFKKDVLNEADALVVKQKKGPFVERRSFVGTKTFTIDPDDAKDFDDAISFKKLKNNRVEVGVHIADVSHYVKPDTAIDKEAFRRSNSVYLADRVVPMLPEQLSNFACSLRPKEKKLTFSVVFEVDEKGVVYNQWFGKSLIFSNCRFTYKEAQEIIEGKKSEYSEAICYLNSVAKALRKVRLKSGSINIESSEIKIKTNSSGHPVGFYKKTSKEANKLVEEFMLLANKHVASYLKNKKNFLYRCHDKPDPSKLDSLKTFLSFLGHKIDISNPSVLSKNLNLLLKKIKDFPDFEAVQSMVVRSMSKATYEKTNIGHFGLGFDFYTHFTSPIRRYADLVVHRILQEELTKGGGFQNKKIDLICKHTSKMERRAVVAERESKKYFQVLFASKKIGETFCGVISGVTEFGLFVKMDELLCEGLVPIKNIPGDSFCFNKTSLSFVGIKTKKKYRFGDLVIVRIQNTSIQKRQIDLKIIISD